MLKKLSDAYTVAVISVAALSLGVLIIDSIAVGIDAVTGVAQEVRTKRTNRKFEEIVKNI